jgi:putative transposase
MGDRQLLPHEIPYWVDPAKEVWFLTICCKQRGKNHLIEGETPSQLLESVKFRHAKGHWFAHVFIVMPDHCHALFTFPQDRPLAKTVRDWKHWTAANLGVAWQTDFFEHRLRDEEAFRAKFRYILENPVRAGLVGRSEDWPHTWIASQALNERSDR